MNEPEQAQDLDRAGDDNATAKPPKTTPHPGPTSSQDSGDQQPVRIGRYRVERLLGKGGFGRVYLAHDEQLDRRVAVKVPHAKLVSGPEDAKAYLTEARTVANLDHPNIVPVHDVGSTDDCPCYIVSKYIEGTDLATKLKQTRLKYPDAAELVATVAEALHYAHKQGLVHRDVKPGNILIGMDGKPYVVDFGLALREENIGKGPKHAGTPAYMSPEQARGEGHRVDGRSDIYSLGVVLYELLSGRRTFLAQSADEMLDLVATQEPKPPRMIDDSIPRELERICLKAISKRASDRYTTSLDMAQDLRHFSAQYQATMGSGTTPTADTPAAGSDSTKARGDSATLDSDSQPIRIVPKGLRSFDAHDADFFLELLPGARDREGLPDSIRFWKTRIEETGPDNTFSVGLIYGPSGW
ncbi:MAG: serine/threonine protein kinase [Planctomycetes bacterium]|nr:serine/threonine protein kinase [Planctomycetota bacterium]